MFGSRNWGLHERTYIEDMLDCKWKGKNAMKTIAYVFHEFDHDPPSKALRMEKDGQGYRNGRFYIQPSHYKDNQVLTP